MSPISSLSAAQPLVLRSDAHGVATLTLNRPGQRNALSMSLMDALGKALGQVASDPAIKVVVLAGAGPAFCSGHDLKELRASPSRAGYEDTFRLCSALMLQVTRLPKPVIARVHGVASAAGCQLVASCDLVVASTEARFATPGVNIGLFCSTPMVALSRAVGRKQAMEMLLTGDLIDAETAVLFGLVNRVAPPEELDEQVMGLAQQIASKSPHVLKIGKEAFYRQVELPLEEAYAYTAEVMTENMMAADAAEGIDAFIQKRAPIWRNC